MILERSEGVLVEVLLAGLTHVTEVAPYWSRLRNRMLRRVHNDVILGLTSVHFLWICVNELLVPQGGLAHLPVSPFVYISVHVPRGGTKLTPQVPIWRAEIIFYYECPPLSNIRVKF